MYNDGILVPGMEPKPIIDKEETQENKYLLIDNALWELQEKGKLSDAIKHLGLNTIIENITSDISNILDNLENIQNTHSADLKSIKDRINELLEELDDCFHLGDDLSEMPTVKKKPLITEEKVNSKLDNYNTKSLVSDVIKNEITTRLINYIRSDQVYTIDKTYNQKEIRDMLDVLATKVDEKVESQNYAKLSKVNNIKNNLEKLINLKVEDINNELNRYYKKREVYSKSETYSCKEISNIIHDLVEKSVDNIILEHLSTSPHIDYESVRDIVENYSNKYLVDKVLLENTISQVSEECEKHKPIWKPSGPVLTTVGYVEDNTEFDEPLTLQQILDAIFYGADISISADESVEVGEFVDVTMCVRIGIPVKSIELYIKGNPKPIGTFDIDDFAEGCITRPYGPISEDTEFIFKVVYVNDEVLSKSAKVTAAWPLFVGITPPIKAESTITMAYLKDLIKEDKINNEFVTKIPVVHKYNFRGSDLKQLIVGIPVKYNKELDYMSNNVSTLTREAFATHRIGITKEFEEWSEIEPLQCMYDFYIYSQPLSSLNSEVTFNFVDKNEQVL